jgi:lipopolysaccharide/colanic/teichoic acid biosynthesis glycosyltransferase
VILRKWEDLPESMKNKIVRTYYDVLYKKRFDLFVKRLFDITFGIITLIILLPVFLVISIVIKIDSNGPVMFRQVRVTQYGKQFRIFKFRTMVINAENVGTQVTQKNDSRVTKIGRFLRKYRLDEIPQLLNIITGDMSFVGTRPEVVKYVQRYTDEMMATLLLPAGVTSEASIHYRDEELLLAIAEDIEDIYVNKMLPEKMRYNLKSIELFSFFREIKTILKTVLAVVK